MSEQHNTVIETPFIKDLISRSLLYINSGFPVHITGTTGIGKTTIALEVARQIKRPVNIIRGHKDISNYDLLGGMVGYANKTVEDNYIHSVLKKEVRTKPVWADGQLVEAVKYGYTVVYDEFNRSIPEINNLFLSVLEEKVLPLYGLLGASQTEPYVQVHHDFRILFISNPDEYVGVHAQQNALIDRMITINMDSFDFDTYAQIVARKAEVPSSLARAVSRFVHRVLLSQADIQQPSLRAAIMIASVMKQGSIPINAANSQFEMLSYEVLSRYVKKENREALKTALKREIQHINEYK